MIAVNTRSPLVIICLAFTSVVCLFDWVARFAPQGERVREAPTLQYRAGYELVTMSNEYRNRIYKKYEVYVDKKVEPEVNAVKTMTIQEQEKQTGVLQELFVGDTSLTLKAVINRQLAKYHQVSILINVRNLNDNTDDLIKVNESETLFGYNWTHVSNTQIELIKNDSQQKVILTMYKPANHEIR